MMTAAGSSSTGVPACSANQGCTCSNGLQGVFNCDTMQCDCDSCPAFTPGSEAPFTACGGDATGFWRLSKEDVASFALRLTDSSGATVQTCLGQVVSQAADSTFLLEVNQDGSAGLYTGTSQRVVNFAESCLLGCETSNGITCQAQACGLCNCTVAPATDGGEAFTWTANAGTLSLTNSNLDVETLPYCVAGDTLVSQPAEGNARITLQRAYRTGVPQACAERTPANCAIGGGCVLGQCSGSGTCTEGFDQPSCEKYQGCSWESTTCSGEVGERCTISDYGQGTPGCVLSDKPATCSGTAKACVDQKDCAAKGCLIGSACVGGMKACFIDSGVPGCTCNLDGICTGTFDCANVSEDHCGSAGLEGSCHWDTMACVATPTPCEQLSVTDCETTAGCVLTAQ